MADVAVLNEVMSNFGLARLYYPQPHVRDGIIATWRIAEWAALRISLI